METALIKRLDRHAPIRQRKARNNRAKKENVSEGLLQEETSLYEK